ncbi:MAG: bifunctional pantoate--beta-alanine ligase/(d)CMP kinase [Cyanobacteria bacterium P01_A01_bin.105]
MRILKTVEGLTRWRAQAVGTVGLVPTMGALHAGHLSLICRARQANDWVVVSIFVNPLQFGPTEDLDRYPRTWSADVTQCEAAGVDAIFAPTVAALYGHTPIDQHTRVIPPPQMVNVLCGRSRPGHFEGVTTVVTKLLTLAQPHRAYFGQKDAQQLAILRRLVQELNLPGQVVACPIVRSQSGLALSSRNQYLNELELQQAAILYQALSAAKAKFKAGERSRQLLVEAAIQTLQTAPALTAEYLELVHPETLHPLHTVETTGMLAIAAHLGATRLIDNILLRTRQPIIAIDGPAGAGKSTVARRIAHQLGLLYLDTGAMYRALTWFVLSQGADPADEVAVAELLPACHIKLTSQGKLACQDQANPQPPEVWVNGELVTQAIRTAEVTSQVSTIAAQGAVREALVKQQQQYGVQGGIVADGRDIGTQVFPDAELKIFLTASVQERARRRQKDLLTQSLPVPALGELEQAIAARDHKDSTRAISPLRKAEEAVEMVTDDLSADAVIEQICSLYAQIA